MQKSWTAFAAVILAASLIVSAFLIRDGLNNLASTVSQKSFTSIPPSEITVKTNTPDQSDYFSVFDAAAYLKMSENEILNLISKGELDGYTVQTSSGNVISKAGLDAWFQKAAKK